MGGGGGTVGQVMSVVVGVVVGGVELVDDVMVVTVAMVGSVWKQM